MHFIRWFFFSTLLFVLAFISPLNATHIVGGDFNYTCLGNDEYAIEMVVYRDCFYGDPYFDDPAVIGVFDGNNELVTDIGFNGQLRVFPMGDDTLTNQLDDPCFVIPPDVCVHKTTYRDTLTLPFSPGGYTLAYQRCCRNQTIVNIVSPLESGATFLVTISEQALQECNSSAKWKNVPPSFICVDQPIDFDHSAIDDDGDSLVYRLCTPLLGGSQIDPAPRPPSNPPYDEITWIDPPYNVDNMLGGEPLEIDPVTGQLSGIPNTIGQFVVGVCVDEFRDGELISTTRRDFQYNIGDCGETTSAFFAPDFICDNERLELINESSDADSFLWVIRGPGFNDSTFTSEDLFLEDLSAGDYSISLVASNDQGCSDTLTQSVTVNKLFNIPQLDASFGSCADSIPIILEDSSIINDTGTVVREWKFYVGDRLISTEPPFYATSADSILITLELIGSNPCSLSDSVVLAPPFPDVALADSLLQCSNDSIDLNPGLIGSDYDIVWRPRELFEDRDSLNPRIRLDSSQYVYYTVLDDSLCTLSGKIWVEVFPIDSLNASFDFPDFACLGDTAEIKYTGAAGNTFEWQVSTPAFRDSTFSDIDTFPLYFTDTGQYSVTLLVQGENGCEDTLTQSLRIDAPWAQAEFSVVEGMCGDSIFLHINDNTTSKDTVPPIRDWSLFDPSGQLVSTTLPFFISEPGEYTVVLKVTDSRGCMDSTQQTISSPLIELPCCPDFRMEPVEACNPDQVELCGQINLDSCVVNYLYAEYSFSYDDSVEIVERVPVDSNGRFCFIAGKSFLDRDACLEVWVDLYFAADSAAEDTIVWGSEIINLAGDCINEICCPEDTIPIHLAKNLCLTGANYAGAHFELEGSILLDKLPEGLDECGHRPRFEQGVKLDYEHFTVFGRVIEFSGILFIPHPEKLDRDPATGKYIIRGSMVFCDESGTECELDVFLTLSRSQLDMCVGMPGLMCMHFPVNTYQYRPPIPPQQYNGWVYLPLSVRVPYGTRIKKETECEVERYDFEICGIPRKPSTQGHCKPIATGHIERKGDEIAGRFFEYLSFPIHEWNGYSAIQVKFWNNCNDTCELEPIPVVPLVNGRWTEENNHVEESLLIYPVPFRDHFEIRYPAEWESSSFQVLASDGSLMRKGKLQPGLNELRVDASTWTPGTYLFFAKGKGERNAKIILIKQ